MGKRRPGSIPKYAAPVARSVALKVKAIRELRGLSIEQCATQLGIAPGLYYYLETAQKIPGPVLSQRLLDWALDPSYRAEGPLSEAHYGLRKKGEWKRVRFEIPKGEYRRVKSVAIRHGMSVAQFAMVAVRMLTKNRRALATIADAVSEIQWARTIEALNESPELRDFIKADLALAREFADEPIQEVSERPAISKFLELSQEKISVVNLESEVEIDE